MQRNLSPLTRELQKETCPQRVHDEVRRRIAISAQDPSPGWLRYAFPAGALAGLLLVCGVSIWKRPEAGIAQRGVLSAARAQQNRVQVATQATEALQLIGSIVAQAGADSGKVISEQAVPPLRNSLLEAKNKIIPQIEL